MLPLMMMVMIVLVVLIVMASYDRELILILACHRFNRHLSCNSDMLVCVVMVW